MPGLPIYYMAYFLYFKVRKTTFLYYRPNLVSESLARSLKFSAFFPDLYHSFLIPSLCRVALRITVKCIFAVLTSHFSVLVSLVCVVT